MAGAGRAVLAKRALIGLRWAARFIHGGNGFEVADWPKVAQASRACKYTGFAHFAGAVGLRVVACTVGVVVRTYCR